VGVIKSERRCGSGTNVVSAYHFGHQVWTVTKIEMGFEHGRRGALPMSGPYVHLSPPSVPLRPPPLDTDLRVQVHGIKSRRHSRGYRCSHAVVS